MRSALLAVIVGSVGTIVTVGGIGAVSATTLIGCGDASTSAGNTRRGRGVPEVGSDEEHDPSDLGEQSTDTGNPNADTLPPAPTTAGQAAGELGVTVSNATPTADLGTKVDVDVVVEPKAGFKGEVDLAVAGLPQGAVATFTPAKVTLDATSVTAKLSIDVPVTTPCTAPGAASALTITAKAGTVQATANANFKVNPKLLLTIPVNIDALRAAGGTKYLDQWGTAFGATQQSLRTQDANGIVVTVKNADSAPHIVHGANGFAHGDTGTPIAANAIEMQNGAPRTRTLNVGANANGYMHEGANGPSVSFRIKVEAAP